MLRLCLCSFVCLGDSGAVGRVHNDGKELILDIKGEGGLTSCHRPLSMQSGLESHIHTCIVTAIPVLLPQEPGVARIYRLFL